MFSSIDIIICNYHSVGIYTSSSEAPDLFVSTTFLSSFLKEPQKHWIFLMTKSLFAVVDANAKFIFIDIGDFGRHCDGGILRESNFGKLLDNNKLLLPPPRKIHKNVEDEFPFVFVADEAYPLKKNLMRPFARKQLTNSKRIYNYRHSRARRIVECAFGILTKRFNVFENKMLVNPEKATIITQAACVLHNLIMDKEQNLTDIHNEMETTSSRVYQEYITKPTNRRLPREAMDIRLKVYEIFQLGNRISSMAKCIHCLKY